jgi:hypothetical protein
MILYWLFLILVISFFTRNFNSSDKVKLWVLILFGIYIIKKTKIIKDKKENLSQTIPIIDENPNNIIINDKFNNFFNNLFKINNRDIASLNNTNNKNIK